MQDKNRLEQILEAIDNVFEFTEVLHFLLLMTFGANH